MRLSWMIGLVLAAACLLAGPQAHAQDVLARARQGDLQCFQPDIARKTCAAIASFTPRSDGGFNNAARVLIAADPVIVMSGSTPVTLRDGAVCGPMTRADLDAAQFTINGQLASAEDAATLRAQLAEMPGFLANETCAVYRQTGVSMTAEYTIDGTPAPDQNTPVIWVRIEDGYRVSP